MQNLQTSSSEKNTKIKVVELQKLLNFVVDNFFVQICLQHQTTNLYSVVLIRVQQKVPVAL